MWNLSISDAWSWLNYSTIAITCAQYFKKSPLNHTEWYLKWDHEADSCIRASVSIVRNFGNSRLSIHFLNQAEKTPTHPPTRFPKPEKTTDAIQYPILSSLPNTLATFLPFAPAEPLLLPRNIKSVKSFPVLISTSFNLAKTQIAPQRIYCLYVPFPDLRSSRYHWTSCLELALYCARRRREKKRRTAFVVSLFVRQEEKLFNTNKPVCVCSQ